MKRAYPSRRREIAFDPAKRRVQTVFLPEVFTDTANVLETLAVGQHAGDHLTQRVRSDRLEVTLAPYGVTHNLFGIKELVAHHRKGEHGNTGEDTLLERSRPSVRDHQGCMLKNFDLRYPFV